MNIEEERPARFLKLEVPMQLFENVHHHDGDFREAFDGYLRSRFGHLSFQAPDKIKQALGHVTDRPLWPGVAAVLANNGAEEVLSTPASVVGCLGEIVQRRHKIAHEADRDPEDGTVRLAISHHDSNQTIDRVEQIANAVAEVLGPPPAAVIEARPVPVPAVPAAAGVPPKQALYLRYWTEFKPVVERHGWTTAQPQPQNWWNMPGGVTGTTWALSFSRFGCRSELYFEHPDPAINLARWQLLADRRDDIIARFGDGLIFDELPQNKGCRIETRLRAAVAAVGGVPSIMG